MIASRGFLDTGDIVIREEPATHWLYVSFGSRPVCGFAAFDELWTRFPANCATRKGVIPYP